MGFGDLDSDCVEKKPLFRIQLYGFIKDYLALKNLHPIALPLCLGNAD